MKIVSFNDEHVEAVCRFNGRLRAAGITYQFPEQPTSSWLPKIEGRRIYQEYFVAVDRTSEVRGAYILKQQEFWIRGRAQQLAFYHLPISEGLVDRSYAMLGVQLLADALKRQPWLFALGIGGFHEPLAAMLGRLKWRLQAVPFYFKVIHPFRVARELTHLRKTRLRRMLLDASAFTGGAWLGARLAQARRSTVSMRNVAVDIGGASNGPADELWQRCRAGYALIGSRDSQTLNILYPPQSERLIRLTVSRNGSPVGWAIVTDTAMRENKFGSLRVGAIVDNLAVPEEAATVASAAADHLRGLGVDLIVSNQAAAPWGRALSGAGFLKGPSTFLFGASPTLSQALHPCGSTVEDVHLNRGDGDGPINL